MGSERDGGREAIQNRYPVAMKPPAGRNAADLSASHLRSDRLVVGSHERLAGLEASSVALDVVAMFLVFQLRVCDAHSIMIAVLHVVFSILSELSCLSRAVRAW